MKRTKAVNIGRPGTITPPLWSPFSKFYMGLDIVQRKIFARRADTTERYLTYKLVMGERMPSRVMIANIARAGESFGQSFTREELFSYFDAATVKVKRRRERGKRQQQQQRAEVTA